MKIRRLRESDLDQVFGLFRSASITKEQINGWRAPKNGFYEYPLEERDFKVRIDPNFSLCLDENGRIRSYVLAYPITRVQTGEIPKEKDPVLRRIFNASPGTIYFDQFFLQPGLPAYLAGRVLNVWDRIVNEEGTNGVVTAIPQRPWKNVSSTRMVIYRGFKREGLVATKDVDLGLFTKPLVSEDFEFAI